MNCEALLKVIGWECAPSGNRSILATSPLTLGDDGQHVSFYIAQPDDDSFFLTDACNSAMYASQLGINLTKSRIDSLNSTFGVSLARFGSDFEIVAEGKNEDLQDALWDAVKLAMSLSFNSRKWMPKFNGIRFKSIVTKLLTNVAGEDRVLKSVKAIGFSGHTVEFPLAVKSDTDNSLFFIEPIAILESNNIDWSHVYQAMGKLTDVKQADNFNHRIVVLEEGASKQEYGKASTILSQCALVRALGTPQSWQKTLAAAH